MRICARGSGALGRIYADGDFTRPLGYADNDRDTGSVNAGGVNPICVTRPRIDAMAAYVLQEI